MLCTKLCVESLMRTVSRKAMGVIMLQGWAVMDQDHPKKVLLMIFQCILGVLIGIGNACTLLAFLTKLKTEAVNTLVYLLLFPCAFENISDLRRLWMLYFHLEIASFPLIPFQCVWENQLCNFHWLCKELRSANPQGLLPRSGKWPELNNTKYQKR